MLRWEGRPRWLRGTVGRDGLPTSEPTAFKVIVEGHFTGKQAPPKGQKAGNYLHDETPRDYPLERKAADDRFMLEMPASVGLRKCLWDRMADKVTFGECIRGLSGGKHSGLTA